MLIKGAHAAPPYVSIGLMYSLKIFSFVLIGIGDFLFSTR